MDYFPLKQVCKRLFSIFKGMITDRIKYIIENEGITIADFERIIGTSQGTINKAIKKKADISSKWLAQILEKFPLYSAQWLLTGKDPIKDNTDDQKINLISTHSNFHGEVLIGASKAENGQPTDISLLLVAIETLTEQIREKDRQINNLITLISKK